MNETSITQIFNARAVAVSSSLFSQNLFLKFKATKSEPKGKELKKHA